jgi:hypothetical protein
MSTRAVTPWWYLNRVFRMAKARRPGRIFRHCNPSRGR